MPGLFYFTKNWGGVYDKPTQEVKDHFKFSFDFVPGIYTFKKKGTDFGLHLIEGIEDKNWPESVMTLDYVLNTAVDEFHTKNNVKADMVYHHISCQNEYDYDKRRTP